ncbi:serine hydrolase [Chitinophaga lutea]
MSRLSAIVLLALFACTASAQPRTDRSFEQLLMRNASPALKHILQHPDSFQVQLIYTQIDRDAQNRPHFKHYYYQVDAKKYFNPASTVKMPLAFLSLEKLRRLGIGKYTTMLTDSAWSGQTRVTSDTSAENGLPSIAHYIKKIFLTSDNDAYNRLYEFLGQQAIHDSLRAKGYPDVRIVRRFVPMDEEENRHTNPVYFVRGKDTVYRQQPAYSTLQPDYSRPVFVGRAHLDRDDKLIERPMDFTRHNNAPLADLQQMLQSVLFPESVPASRRFHLGADDYRFLWRYMAALPSESRYPRYDTVEYFDSYTKFFRFKAGKSKLPPYIRVFNKTGWSYGFLTDVAYFADFKNNVEFMLTGNIYVNRDGVLNDNKYEYEEEGYPFFKEVGDIVYEHELIRSRPRRPDLSKFAEATAGLGQPEKAITRGDTTRRRMAIVFTGHDYAEGGMFIADVLKRLKVPASFFFTGEFYGNPAFRPLIDRLRRDGHYLAGHSNRHLLYCDWTRRDSLLVTRDSFEVDLDSNYAAIAAHGLPTPHYFLPPYEWYNDSIVHWTAERGLQLVNFTPGTRSTADYTYPEMGKSYRDNETIMNSILDYEKSRPAGLNGFILLLHAGTDPRRKEKFYFQLEKLIRYLQGKKYELVTIPRLLP